MYKATAHVWRNNLIPDPRQSWSKWIKLSSTDYKDLNPIALRKAKIVWNFGPSECNRVKVNGHALRGGNYASSAAK